MHKKTLRRLVSMSRLHSSSSYSAVGVGFLGSTPALLKAKSSRPNVVATLAKAASTSSDRVTSQRTASACPPCSSIMRAVPWLPRSDKSATTTLTPSRANASAAARPMPLAAPVTNATFSSKPLLSFIAVAHPSVGEHKRLHGAALVHRAVALCCLLDRQGRGAHGGASARTQTTVRADHAPE